MKRLHPVMWDHASACVSPAAPRSSNARAPRSCEGTLQSNPACVLLCVPRQPREEELLVELEEKERQLAIAAEIGQSLVHKAEDLQRRHDMLAESAARTSSGMDESDYRIREVTSQNERLLELLAQSEADLAEVQKQSASEPAASPAGEGNEGFDESDQPSVRKQQQVIVVMRSEITALQQRVAELNKDNEELLEAKLMEEVCLPFFSVM